MRYETSKKSKCSPSYLQPINPGLPNSKNGQITQIKHSAELHQTKSGQRISYLRDDGFAPPPRNSQATSKPRASNPPSAAQGLTPPRTSTAQRPQRRALHCTEHPAAGHRSCHHPSLSLTHTPRTKHTELPPKREITATGHRNAT